MKILMICNTDAALYVFRNPLIRRLVALGHSICSITDHGGYLEKLSRMGVKTAALSFERSSASLAGNIRLLFQLRRLIASEQPDIVHNFTHKPAIFGTLAARAAGVRAIFITISGLGTLFCHEDLRTRLLRSLLLLQYKIALRLVTKVFFQNPDDMAYFLGKKLVAPDKAILTYGSGIDIKEFSNPLPEDRSACRGMLGHELGLQLAERIVVIFPARAIKEKGFTEFYEAARMVTSQYDRYVFIHLGLVDENARSGISRERIDSYSKACGVHYLGFKDNIMEYLIAADIVALPSTYREGVPRSLIEALALDKYIITTDAPGCRETVIDGWNGALCRPGDAADLAAKISTTDHTILLHSKGRSRALCEEKFDVEQLIDITLKCYLESQATHG